MNQVNVQSQYTPKQRKERKNLKHHIQQCRVQYAGLFLKTILDEPTKPIEATAIQLEIATAHLALAKYDHSPDGETWIYTCEARCNRLFRDYQKAVRWALLGLLITPIVTPLRHNIGMYRPYRLSSDIYYGVFPK